MLRASGVKGLPLPGAWNADGTVVFATYDAGIVERVAARGFSGHGACGRTACGAHLRHRRRAKPCESAPPVGSCSPASRRTSTSGDCHLMRKTGLANGAIERVTDNAARDQLMNLSDDGRTMAFSSSRTGQDDAWIRDVHTGRDRQVTYSNSRGVRVSRDGSMLALGRGIAENGKPFSCPHRTRRASPLCDDCLPGDWSPDGTRLVIQRGNPSRLLVRELGSSREMELAAHPTWNLLQATVFSGRAVDCLSHDEHPLTAPDLCGSGVHEGSGRRSSAWMPIVPDFGVQPSWAPDGSAVYHFSLRDGAFCAWLQPLDPGNEAAGRQPTSGAAFPSAAPARRRRSRAPPMTSRQATCMSRSRRPRPTSGCSIGRWRRRSCRCVHQTAYVRRRGRGRSGQRCGLSTRISRRDPPGG